SFSQLVGNLLPVGGWRIYTISGSMPIFDPHTWRLDIGGLVRRPVSLSYDQLTSLPRAEQVTTFHCVTGWTVRVVLPEMYGYKGVKWLTRMNVVAKQPTGYWEGLGYDQDAWVGRSNGYCPA